MQRCRRCVSCSSAEFAARAEGEGCNGTSAVTPFAKLRTVFFSTSEKKLLPARPAVWKVALSVQVLKSSIRN